MTKNRWFKFFPSDFLTGVRNLNPIEITAYIVVICELYDHEGMCPRDDAQMSSACRIRKGDFTRALDSLIAKGKLNVTSGMLSNKRVSEEVERRIIAAKEKARQRHGGDMATTRPRHEEPEKPNKNNATERDVRAYKEERIKKSLSSFDVSAEPRGIEGLLFRQQRRSGKMHS